MTESGEQQAVQDQEQPQTHLTLTKNSMVGISVAGLLALVAAGWQASAMHSDIMAQLARGDRRYSESRDRQQELAEVNARQAALISAQDKRLALIEATRYTARDAREDRDRMIALQSQVVALTREIAQLREQLREAMQKLKE